MTMEPTFVTMKARDLKPYHYGLWSSVGDGEPFSNTICIIKWSEDGEHLWLCLDSHNFHKISPDEDIEVVVEVGPYSKSTRNKYASWTLPPKPKPEGTQRYDHRYQWSADGPECGICKTVHQPNFEPLEAP